MGKSNFALPNYLYYGGNANNKMDSSPSANIDVAKVLNGESSYFANNNSNDTKKKTVVINLQEPFKNRDLISELTENGFEVILKDGKEFNIDDKQIEDEELSRKPRHTIAVIDKNNLNSVRLDMHLAPFKDKPDLKADESNEFNVWKEDTVANPDDLMAKLSPKLSKGGNRNTLITCSSGNQLAGVRYKILKSLNEGMAENQTGAAGQAGANQAGINYKVIDSADELRLALSATVNSANEIEAKSRQDGELYKLITGDSSQKKVLIVDWSNFSKEEVSRCNSILNVEPTLDGVELNGVNIVSLQTVANKGQNLDEDFESRHQSEINVPADVHFETALKAELADEKQLEGDPFKIDLQGKEDPMATLKGQCIINKNKAIWKEGELIEAIKSGRNIVIQNMPKHGNEAERIRRLLEDAIRTGELEVYGKKFKLSQGVKVYFGEASQTIKLEDVKAVATFKARQPTEEDICVNPSNFSQLSQASHIDENGDMITEAGLIEQNAGKTMPICISASISNSQWKDLVNMAKKYNVKLDITVEESIALPFTLPRGEAYKLPKEGEQVAKDGTKIIRRGRVMTVEDVGFSVRKMITNGASTVFIDTSEMTNDNLIGSVVNKTRPNKDGCQFKFESLNGAIINALMDGESVCVYGDISQDLINSLSSIVANGTININGKQTKVAGTLTILADKELGIPSDSEMGAKYNDKKMLLQMIHLKRGLLKKGIGIYDGMTNEDKVKLGKTYSDNDFNTLSAFIASSKEEIGQLFEDLEPTKKQHSQASLNPDFDNAEKIAEEFDERRMSAVTKKLKKNPCAFVIGEDGCGKTSFFESPKFAKTADIFRGMESLEEWAKEEEGEPKFDKQKVLLIDEHEIDDSKYSIFDGLYEDQDIIVGNQHHKLDSRHRVVFTANSRHYEKDRKDGKDGKVAKKIPDIIAKHEGILKFEEIPPEALYHNIVQSIFEPFRSEKDKQFWTDTVKRAVITYQKINSISDSEQILTPTHLNNAFQTLSSISKDGRQEKENAKGADMKAVDNLSDQECFGSDEIGNALRMNTQFSVPEKYKEAVLSAINEEFGEPKVRDLERRMKDKLAAEGFYVTDSNKHFILAVDDAIRLRDLNMIGMQVVNKSAIIIESETELNQNAALRLIMEERSFKEMDLASFDMKRSDQITAAQSFNGFVTMPNQATAEQKEIVIKWAFNNGVTLVWDGFNSTINAPLERILNTYLCGKDLDGNLPKKSGFFIVATQAKERANGRLKLSDSSMRHAIKVAIPDYKDEELAQIAQIEKQDISEQEAKAKVSQYREAQAYAAANNLTSPKFNNYLASVGRSVQKAKPPSLNQINKATKTELKNAAKQAAQRAKSKTAKYIKKETGNLPPIEPRAYDYVKQEVGLKKTIREAADAMSKQKEDKMKVDKTKGFKTNFFGPPPDPKKKKELNINSYFPRQPSRLKNGRVKQKVDFGAEGKERKTEYSKEDYDIKKPINYNPNAKPKPKDDSFLKNANQDVVGRLIAIFGFEDVDDFIKNADKESIRVVKLAVANSKFEEVDFAMGKEPIFEEFCANIASKGGVDIEKMSEKERDEMISQLAKSYNEYTYNCYKKAQKIEEKDENVTSKFNSITECLTQKDYDKDAICDSNEIMQSISSNSVDGLKKAIAKNSKSINEYSIYHGSNAIISCAVKAAIDKSDDGEAKKMMQLLLSQKEVDLKSRHLLNGMTAFHIACVSRNEWLQQELLKKDPECDKVLDFFGRDAKYYSGIPQKEADLIYKYITESRGETGKDDDALSQSSGKSVRFESDKPKEHSYESYSQSDYDSAPDSEPDSEPNDAPDGAIDRDQSILQEFTSTNLNSKSGLNDNEKDRLLKMIADISSVNKSIKSNAGAQSANVTMLSSLSSQFCSPKYNKQLEELIKAIKNRSADVNMVVDSSGNNALHLAALGGHNNTLKLLLNTFGNKVNYSAKTSKGDNLAHIALMKGYADRDSDGNIFAQDGSCSSAALVKQIVLSLPSIVNQKMGDGNTLLHIAAMMRDFETVKFLIENGADIEAIGKDKATPRDMMSKTYGEASQYISGRVGTFMLDQNKYNQKDNTDKISQLLASPALSQKSEQAEASISGSETAGAQPDKTHQDKTHQDKAQPVEERAPQEKVREKAQANNRLAFGRSRESVRFYGNKNMISIYRTSGDKDEMVAVKKYKAVSDEFVTEKMKNEDALRREISDSIVDVVCKARDECGIDNGRAIYLLQIAEKNGGIGNLSQEIKAELGIKASDMRFSYAVQRNIGEMMTKNTQLLSPKDSKTPLRTKRILGFYNLINIDGVSLEESLQNRPKMGKDMTSTVGISI